MPLRPPKKTRAMNDRISLFTQVGQKHGKLDCNPRVVEEQKFCPKAYSVAKKRNERRATHSLPGTFCGQFCYFLLFLDDFELFFDLLLPLLLLFLPLALEDEVRDRLGRCCCICCIDCHNAIEFPSGSVPITLQPIPGTSCFSTTTVPPACLNFSVWASMSSTPMKSLGLSFASIFEYIPPPRCSGPVPVVSISQYSMSGMGALLNFQPNRSP